MVTWIMRKPYNYLSPTHQDHAQQGNTQQSSPQEEENGQSSSSRTKSFVYIKDTTKENMKYLQVSLPYVLGGRYFLGSAHIKDHKICWKGLCHSLERSPNLVTNKRASSYPLMFSEGKKIPFSIFCMGTQSFCHLLLVPLSISNQRIQGDPELCYCLHPHKDLISWVLCIEFTPLLKSFD